MSQDTKEERKKAEMQFVGQASDEARAAVKLQRELKKKRDAHRKLEKKLKGMKEGEAHADYAATRQELDSLAQEIATMEAKLNVGHTSASAPAKEKGNAPEATAKGVAPAATATLAVADNNNNKNNSSENSNSKKKTTTATTENTNSPVEDVEANRKKLMELLEKTRQRHRAERGVLTRYHGPSALSSSSPLLLQMRHGSATGGVIHPRVAEVALLMEEMLIVGGNARTLAMIHAFRELVAATAVLANGLLKDVDTTAFEQLIEANFAFLRRRREATSGMRYVKSILIRRLVALRDEALRQARREEAAAKAGQLHRSSSPVSSTNNDLGSRSGSPLRFASAPPAAGGTKGDTASVASAATPASASSPHSFGDAREVTLQILGAIESELKMSLRSIVEDRSLPYVTSSDVILVFGRSSAVQAILMAHTRQPWRKPKKVIVLDSAPLYEGRQLALTLTESGVEVTYALITACCTLMPRCTRVFIGAASVLQNGDVFGRCGTALVAACAKSFHKPVLCFCESYKFVPAVWLGNLAQNAKLHDIRTAAGTRGDGGISPLRHVSPNALGAASPTQQFGLQGGNNAGSAAAMMAMAAATGYGNMNGSFAAAAGGGGSGGGVWGKGEGAAGSERDLQLLSATASGYLYDLTPAAFVDMIICEMGCLHTTAIVAAIRDREGRDAAPMLYMMKS